MDNFTPNQSNISPVNPSSPSKKWPPKFISLLIIALVVLGAVAYGGVLYWQNNYALPISSNTPTPSNAASETPASSPDATGSPAPNTIVQWRGDGVPMADLKLVTSLRDDLNAPHETPVDIKYYDMGVNGNNKVILAVAPSDMAGYSIFLFEQISGSYRFMSKMSSVSIYTKENQMGYVLSLKVTGTDTTTFYNGIVGPDNFTWRGINLKSEQKYPSPSDLFKNYVNAQKTITTASIQKVDVVNFGDLYLDRRTRTADVADNAAKFYISQYILKLPSGLYTTYNVRYDFFTDDSVPRIVWNDGTSNKDAFRQDPGLGGCGNPGAFVVPASDVADAVQISGVTNTGEKIYEFKDINDPVMKFFYGLGGKAYNATTGQFDSIPLDQWAAHHAVILYKNAIGDYVIFTNDKYGSGAECGKPVIYLYPTKPTNARVQVGANITVSEPEYGNGWNVLAQPDGTLNANGKIYSSLYWEGVGRGDYPSITEGIIVPSSKITETLKSQLKELGLSGKESADFLEFWLPKMPKTNYTRLTWFGTEQMNRLAPLAIWPRPDTMIRVFLDFQGLDNPVPLPAQRLGAIPRQGFTVVEWGGILRK